MSTLKPLTTTIPNKSNLLGLMNNGTPTPQPSPTIMRSSSTLRSLNPDTTLDSGKKLSAVPVIPLDEPETKKRSPRIRRPSPEKKKEEPKQDTTIHSISDLLLQAGLLPIGYVLCKASDNSDIGVCNYVKVMDKAGHMAYVEPDVEGSVPMDKDDFKTIFAREAKSKVPQSVKQGTMGVVGQDVDGVAIEFEDEICTIVKHGKDQKIKEKAFIHENQIEGVGEPIAYPLVKMSLLLHQPIIIRQTIEEVYIRLREIDYVGGQERLQGSMDKIKDLYKTVEKYDNFQKTVFNDLTNKMKELYNLSEEYKGDDVLEQADKYKLDIIERNLQTRQHILTELIQVNRAVAQIEDRIDQIIKEYQDLTTFAKASFQDLDQIY